MVKIISLLLCFSSLQVLALESKPLRTIEAKLAFRSPVPNPQHLAVCGGRLWTYSVSQKAIWSLDLKSGSARRAIEIPAVTSADMSALTCQGQRLLVAINAEGGEKARPGRPQILEYKLDANLGTATMGAVYQAPEVGRATDLFCNSKLCWILQEKLFVTRDLRKWQLEEVPPVREVPRVNANPELNPFENWQASLVMAKGQYVKGSVSGQGALALLDPFHSRVVIRREKEWEKWGAFGVWEGRFLTPKNLAFVADNVVAVSDSQLHAIFLFRADGVYLGILAGSDSVLYSPLYPLGLAVLGDRLYVADFVDGAVQAFDLTALQSSVQNISEISVRQNLIRRADIPQDTNQSLCLQCHDGTHTNQLFKFVKSAYHHPLECSRCHDPHHQIKARHYLRKEPNVMCMDCHKDHVTAQDNHIWSSTKVPPKKGGVCTDCHKSHAEAPKLLLEQAPKICSDCHREQSINHRPLKNFMKLERANGIKFENEHVSCVTCHQTHKNSRAEHFIKDKDKVQIFCSSCHGVKTENLFKNFHRIMKSKGK